MSYEHNRFALAAARELSARAAHVLLALAIRTDDSGRCHPSIGTIAADVRRDRSNVMDAIGELEAAGLLDVERLGRRRGNIYTVVIGGADATKTHPTFGGAGATNHSTVSGAADVFSGAGATSFSGAGATPTTPELLIELRAGDIVRCPRRPTRARAWCDPSCPLCHGMHHVYAEELGVTS